MKNVINYISLFALIVSISACSSPSSNEETVPLDKEVLPDARKYTADVSNMVLQWTAYKFTEKLGVSGVFDECKVEGLSGPGTIEELLEGTKMNIETASVNSNNEIRDPKLRTNFFKVFHTELITATILNAESGKGDMELMMNGITKDLEFDYSLKRDTLFLNTNLDLMLWNGKEAMDSLNLVCYDLHKGADGISKLWPDVSVALKLPVR